MNISDPKLIRADVRTIENFHDFNLFYLFNPFPEDVFLNFVNNLSIYLSKSNIEAWIVYVNPVHHSLIDSSCFCLVNDFNAPITNFNVKIYKYKNYKHQ